MYRKESPESIQEMFGTIAPLYDRANLILSLGLHRRWNQLLSKAVGGKHLLDLCAGTGDIAFAYLKNFPNARATLLDFSPEMLAIAEKKGGPYVDRMELIVGDAQAIPLPENSVDGVTIAYGIRNVQNPKKCFSEVRRVLIPGGRFAILELTRPPSRFLRAGHALYLRTLLPVLGRFVAGNGDAYSYLARSIEQFTSPKQLLALIEESGFRSLAATPLMGGVATLITAS